ncbi:non-ribosomal peptide synthetase [Pseudoalteromonas umbrosa]|uniref:non-ribosomal peptide synthetase n=1 Tax=Pseudoalteromonas umbrosa TaxID=3048489 RepID=UPI0024C3160D|nr:non-ribosomal peptide synthetase [Pseudoalteromonas sp. B95]MDK1288429.1 amino acid adenylation domain-containing protein [Pseudoalteromonas sp. B95]
MKVAALIKHLKDKGITLLLSDGKLKSQAAPGAITKDIATQIRENKNELVEFLASEQAIPRIQKDEYELSFSQQRLWFLDKLEGQTSTYNMSIAYQLKGMIQVQALEGALNDLLTANPALTAQFHEVNGQARQVFRQDIAVKLQTIQASNLDEELINKKLAEEAQRPFNLTCSPMLRALIYLQAAGVSTLQFTFHHIAVDGWSVELLFDQLAAFYKARVNGKVPVAKEQPSLDLHYGDYAAWQQGYFQAGGFDSSLDYWTQRLANSPVMHALPTVNNRPRKLGTRGDKQVYTIDADLWHKVITLAKSSQVTPYIFLLTAWGSFLQKLSNQQDIVIVTPVAGRNRQELDSVVGMFVNTLPVRLSADFELSFKEVLRDVKQAVMKDFQHDEVPFDVIVEHLGLTRSLSFSPLAQLLFSFQEAYPKTLTLNGLETSVKQLNTETAKFELSLEVTQTDSSADFLWEFNTNLFSHKQIAQWSEQFFHYLNQLTRGADKPLGGYDVITPNEYEYLTQHVNHTKSDYINDKCIHEVFELQVEKHPQAVALVFEEKQLTYEVLNSRANQLAHYLNKHKHISPDTLIGLCFERSVEMVIAILAILKAGGAYVPLDPDYPEARLKYMLDDAELDTVITLSSLIDKTPVKKSQAICLDDSRLQDELSRCPTDNLSVTDTNLQTHHLAYVIYTSGSTGKPKGVLQTHENVCRLFLTTEDDFNFSASDTWTLFHSIAFDFSVWELWGGLLYGGKLVIPNYACTRDPKQFANLCQAQNVTILNQTPSAFSSLSEVILRENLELPHLRCVVFGGEALQVESLTPWWERFGDQQPTLINMYGITETTVHVTYKPLSKTDVNPASVGNKLGDQTIYLLDNYGKLVPRGTVGEIYVGGAGLARGYLNKPEITEERFIADPFTAKDGARLYKSGDLARYLDNGELEFIGRADDQIKIRGFRIELGEIEHQLAEFDGVDSSLVLVKENHAGEKSLVGYAKLNAPCYGEEEASAIVQRIKSAIALVLPNYMLPSVIMVVNEWPLTANGKVDKKALPEPAQSILQTAKMHEFKAPQTDKEQILVNAWSEVLNLDSDKISTLANFFELGGHSLLVVKLVSAVQKLGWELTVQSVFGAANLAELAEELKLANQSDVYQTPANAIPESCEIITPEMLPLINLSQREIDHIASQVPDGMKCIKDIYPLTPLQEGMLYHHMLDPEEDPYVITTYLRVDSRASFEKLVEGLNFVIQRHDVLRTAFFWDELDTPAQVVLRSASIPVQWLQAVDGQDALDVLKENIITSMDLAKAPLFHLAVVDTAQGEHYIKLTWHHLVDDNTSLNIIVDELSAWFTGDTESLPSPISYREAVGHIQHHQKHTDAISFFESMLSDVSEPTAPFELLNVNQKIQATELSADLPRDLSAQIRQWTSENHCSPSAFFHAVWALVISACCSKEQVVFGTVMSGRLQGSQWAEQMVGLLINTLPIKAQLNNQSVLSLVNSISKSIQDLIAYEYTPLTQAQSCCDIEGDAPLFSSIINCRFSFENQPVRDASNEFSFLEAHERTNYPLGLSVDDIDNAYHLTLNVDSSVNAKRVLSYVTTAASRLMTALLQAPEQAANTLSVIPDTEQHQLISAFNNTACPYSQETLIHELFEQQVEKTPDGIALVFGDTELTYQELNTRANQLARRIRDQYEVSYGEGLKPDTFIALYLERNVELIVSILAVLKAGGAYLPISPNDPQKRVQYILQDTLAPILLCQSKFTEQLSEITGGNSSQPELLAVDEPNSLGSYSQGNLPRCGEPSQLAYVIYTSGTTGQPKGALLEHRGIVNLIKHDIKTFDISHGERIMHVLPMQFDAGGQSLFHGLCAGAQIHFTDAKTDLTQFMLSNDINYCAMTPSLLGAQVVRQIPSLKVIMVGGDSCTLDLVNTWTQQCRLYNLYGPTECSIMTTMKELKQNETPVIGSPIANTQVYVLDQQLKPVPIGVTGELYISGVGLARGYHNKPELTKEKFIDSSLPGAPCSRLYRSGDKARWLESGELVFSGRKDHQVKIRGFRIEVQEIEHHLSAIKEISEAHVKARGKAKAKQLVAYITLKDEALNTEQSRENMVVSITGYLDNHLPSHMLPSHYVFLDKMPLTNNGKLDEKALPEPELNQSGADQQLPTSALEIALCELWEQVLGVEKVGLTDNFFSLGGDSILSIQLVSRANNRGISLSVKSLFHNPTIAELVKVVRFESVNTGQQEMVTGNMPLLPIQHFYFDKNTEQPEHFNHSLLLHVPADFSEAYLTKIVDAIYQRHDALRLVFNQGEGGHWQALHTPLTKKFLDDSLSYQIKPESHAWEAWIEAQCGQWQQSFDLKNGPLFKAILLQEGEEPQSDKRLFLLFHHLVIDGVSWRIVLDDLHLAYEQLSKDEHASVVLPRKTASYQTFASALVDYSSQEDSVSELEYWRAQNQTFNLPTEYSVSDKPTIATTENESFTLDRAETELLLQLSNSTYRTHINELLLSGMYLGLCRWGGLDSVKFIFESHGRDVPFSDLDISQTLGWFTSFYPVYFEQENEEQDIQAYLKKVILKIKETVRAIPNNGLGYGLLQLNHNEADAQLSHDYQSVAFNYLGVFDADKQLASLGSNNFSEAKEERGEHQSGLHPRWHKLGLNGWVKQGQLSFTLDYSTLEYSKRNMQSLVKELEQGLRDVIAHCQQAQPCFTPSDFPLANVKQAELAEWQHQFPQMQDLYSATPMQQGMIFETYKEPKAYMQHQDIVFSANTSFSAMQEAWSEVMARHSIMRTRFVGIESANIHQVVLPTGQFEWHQFDWSGLTSEIQDTKWEEVIEQNYDRGCDFTTEPLTRIYLVQLSATRWRLLFTQHHCLSDGWSLPIILGEVFSVAEKKSDFTSYQLPPVADYKQYIDWYFKQSQQQGLQFWQGKLENVTQACLLMPSEEEHGLREYCEQIITFDAVLSQNLNHYCRARSTTLNTVMQMAWSYLLSQYTQSNDVVFGTIVSGRDCDVDGIQSMVGLFINTLPLVAHLDVTETIESYLQTLQKQQLECNQYNYLPLNDVCMQAKNAGIKSGERLFDTLLVTENYPTGEALNASQTLTNTKVEQASAKEHIDFGLSVAVVPDEEFWVRFSYKSGEYSSTLINQISQHFIAIINSIVSQTDPAALVGSLDMQQDEIDDKSSMSTLIDELKDLSEAELAELLMAEEQL